MVARDSTTEVSRNIAPGDGFSQPSPRSGERTARRRSTSTLLISSRAGRGTFRRSWAG